MGRREQIRGRLEAATPGPWLVGWGESGGWVAFVNADGEEHCDERRVVSSESPTPGAEEADAALIAHAPSDLRDLLAVADAAEAFMEDYWCCQECREARNGGPAANALVDALDRLDNEGAAT